MGETNITELMKIKEIKSIIKSLIMGTTANHVTIKTKIEIGRTQESIKRIIKVTNKCLLIMKFYGVMGLLILLL